ncbi:MAG TPA: hypothetical protein VF042_05515 [Gemmatimonadaceae bacterium]
MPERATSAQRVTWHLEHARECGCRPIPGTVLKEILAHFDRPDETREMFKGRFEVSTIEGIKVGRASYEPGWKWSEHVGRALGQKHCNVEHIGFVVAGTAVAAYSDGRIEELREGKRFYVPSDPHDSWVVGNTPYVSLHFVGVDKYSK